MPLPQAVFAEMKAQPSASIVVGLGFGDEGKGATVDFIAASLPTARVVRFNGGQQAGHNVTHDGFHHTFASYGSGTLSGVPTWISRHCTINPLNAREEQQALMPVLTDNTRKIRVHEDALVTTPLHVVVNHRKESERGDNRHGSTGTGFGETIAWSLGNKALTAKDMGLMSTLDFLIEYQEANRTDLPLIDLAKISVRMNLAFAQCYEVVTDEEFTQELSTGHTIFEGAQGLLLDEWHGFHPHTTWSNTTPANACSLAAEAGIDKVEVYGCLRTYATRHGAGPLPHEDTISVSGADMHNPTYEWAGAFRVAPWDVTNLLWAIQTVQPDYLSVSWLDAYDGIMTNQGLLEVSEFGDAKIASYGPDRKHRQ